MGSYRFRSGEFAPCADLENVENIWIRFTDASFLPDFFVIFFFFYSRSNSFVLIGCGFQGRKLLSLEACESTVFQLLGGDGFSEMCLSFARGDIALRHRLTHLSVVSQHVCSARPSPAPRRSAPPRLPLRAASTSRRCGILPDRAARRLWQTVVD